MKSAKNTGLHKIIWLVTLLPLLIAWTMAYFGIGLPSTTKNNGVLMAETMQVPNSLTQLHQGKWGLLVISDHCDARCQQQVYRMQQLYKSMAKHHERIQAIWVASPQTTSRDNFAGDIDFGKVQKVNNRSVFDWFDQQNLAWQDQSIWLIDPNGILVMQFLPELTGRQIMADIKWLLKASRIG